MPEKRKPTSEAAAQMRTQVLALSRRLNDDVDSRPIRTFAERDGGAEEDRTPDLLLAKQALSQLSYGPRAACGRIGGSGKS